MLFLSLAILKAIAKFDDPERYPRGWNGRREALSRSSGRWSKAADSTGLFIDRKRRQYLRGFGELDRGAYNQAGKYLA